MRVLQLTRRAAVAALLLSAVRCTTVDPGNDFTVPDIVFDADYFYCHVEPGYIFQYGCGGPGDQSKGCPGGQSCHYNPSAVSGMPLLMHNPVDCGGGDHPVDMTQVAPGTPAAANYESVSGDMEKDYTTAAVFVRPGYKTGHPCQIFDPNSDTNPAMLLSTWASK